MQHSIPVFVCVCVCGSKPLTVLYVVVDRWLQNLHVHKLTLLYPIYVNLNLVSRFAEANVLSHSLCLMSALDATI